MGFKDEPDLEASYNVRDGTMMILRWHGKENFPQPTQVCVLDFLGEAAIIIMIMKGDQNGFK